MKKISLLVILVILVLMVATTAHAQQTAPEPKMPPRVEIAPEVSSRS